MTKTIYLAGGCFWGLEELLRRRPGVSDTEVGYTGGVSDNPTYEHHTGHAEAVAVTFDDTVTTYENLLEYFFRIHDPTTKNQQGNDMGSSYRSAIFYQTEEEKVTAEKLISLVDESELYNNPVITALEPFTRFWPAEDYHQDYLQKHPSGYTCHFERSGKSIL